jgi:N-acetylmuramoyl-L-alanine amidase
MTNEQDVEALISETKRKKLVQAVAVAIDAYFDERTRMIAAR